MLEVSGLQRCYGDFVAVDDVSFSISTGEIVGLLGHNGAGKTTIMKMLSGYLEPNKGTVEIDNIEYGVDTKRIQRGLGYLPENLPIYPEMTVADYLDYAAKLKGLSHDIKNQEIKRVIEATDLKEKFLTPISTLSRGYKQRVGVAQAILGKPRLLILDEPTNGLDPTQTEQMRALIRDLAGEATVILSTHIMQEVDALCDRVLILNGGRMAVDAKLEDLRRSHYLLLGTSMPVKDAQAILPVLKGVEALEPLADSKDTAKDRYDQYRLKLQADGDNHSIAAAIAEAIIQAEAALYELKFEHRDLETLFREVTQSASAEQMNSSEEVNHAA